jgi:ABC-type tungstate transport system permease subunit
MINLRNILALVAILAAINASSAEEHSIVLASTTSVEASGLLANILPQFTAKTGIKVNVVAQGTGKALDTARRGDADLLLVHDPDAEQDFMDEGHGSSRRQIAWNDFIILGPSADPAHVKGGSDSIAALKAIATSQAPFVSRGDRSGTNAAELRLWSYAGLPMSPESSGKPMRLFTPLVNIITCPDGIPLRLRHTIRISSCAWPKTAGKPPCHFPAGIRTRTNGSTSILECH